MTESLVRLAAPPHAHLGASLLLGAGAVIACGVMLGFAAPATESTSCLARRGGWHAQASDTLAIEVASRWARRTHWPVGL